MTQEIPGDPSRIRVFFHQGAGLDDQLLQSPIDWGQAFLAEAQADANCRSREAPPEGPQVVRESHAHVHGT